LLLLLSRCCCCCCSRILYQEIDYTLEGRNADKFRENFANLDWVKVRTPANFLALSASLCVFDCVNSSAVPLAGLLSTAFVAPVNGMCL
jgi:hypothetical protein